MGRLARKKTKFSGVIYREIITNNVKDKVYYIRYKDVNGKSKEIKIGKESEGVRANYCNQKRNEIITKQRLGEEPPAIAVKKKKNIITLNDVSIAFFKEREIQNKDNAHSASKYKNWIEPVLGHRDVDLIELKDIRELQESLVAKNFAAATINFAIKLLHAIFNYAIENGITKNINPGQKLKHLKLDNARERYLTQNECIELLKAIEKEKELSMFTRLSLSTGGRLETILSIQKKDIDFDNATITLKDHKNNNTYRGFLSSELINDLRIFCQDLKSNDYINTIPTRTLRRQMSKYFLELFNSQLKKDDRKNRVVIHTLRHTFASLLAIKGTPIFTIQKLMNHADIKSTLRYAKLDPESGKNAVQSLHI